MGDILNFEPKRGGRNLRRRGGSASAVVIIFSGVRYERLTDETTKMRSKGKSGRSLAGTNPATTHQ